MKKLTTLVLAAGLVVSSFAGAASAAEFKPFAQFAEEFTYGDEGKQLTPNSSEENFNAATRIRFGFDYIASEDLSATMLFQYRHTSWGTSPLDADPAVDNANDHFRMRLAYIDWTIPSTDVKVRMGRQAVVTPSYAFGSVILDGRGDAVSFNGNINDNIALGLTWLRLDASQDGWRAQDEADAAMLNAEFAYDGWKVAPWVMYVSKQENANIGFNASNAPAGKSADAWVIGVSGELNMFDPFVFALDALYSNTSFNDVTAPNEDGFDAWYVGAKASYKFSNGTAALGGWYASGYDNERNDTGFVVIDGGFAATDITFDGSIVGADGFYDLSGKDSPFGTWGLVAEYANFSFLDKLSHTARVAYIQGTNEADPAKGAHDIFENGGLSEDDSIVEINFDSTYEIYKNFSATLQLGYAIIDQDLAAGQEEQDNVFRSALAFVYNF